MAETLTETLTEMGLGEEKGANNGFYTPEEITTRLATLPSPSLVDSVNLIFSGEIGSSTTPSRVHEALHCFDVGFGAAELVQQIANDGKAQTALGVSPELFTSEYIQAVFLSGLFHDISLALTGESLPVLMTNDVIKQYADPSEHHKFEGLSQVHKDAIGDDLRGAILLERYARIPDETRNIAAKALLAGSDLKARDGATPLGNFNPYKVLDAVWYHDGNYPTRGHAEADQLVGDRVELFDKGQADVAFVGKGVKKLMTYTEEDLAWETRDHTPDAAYLEKVVKKKAGDFLEVIRGTLTYDFVVSCLAARQRGSRTLQSPAFWRGVDMMGRNIKDLERRPELKAAFAEQIDTLYERLGRVQVYRPMR